MSYIIELIDVSYAVQSKKLVSGISFRFEEGKTTAIIGPSGSGKTTVLKLSAGLLIPSEGDALYQGKDIVRMKRTDNIEFRRKSAMVFQDTALWANQDLYQNLDLPLRLHFPKMTKTQRERKIESVVAEVGYKKSMGIRPSELSMGEQKLLGFARALVCDPRLVYLDEWTESLDESAAQRLIGIVKKMRADGVTVILVSHDLQILHTLVDSAMMIMGGHMTATLTKEQLVQDGELERHIEEGIAP